MPSFSQDPDIPDTAITWGFGDKLAPRLGFAWDATGDGRTKLYGSWGVFYDIMKLLMPLDFGGNFQSLHWYTLDDPDISRIENNPACPPECPGALIYEWIVPIGDPINNPENPIVDPDLQPTKLQEAGPRPRAGDPARRHTGCALHPQAARSAGRGPGCHRRRRQPRLQDREPGIRLC